MKFGETFTEYLQSHQEIFWDKCCHVEYKRLKKVLKSCRRCRSLKDSADNNDGENDEELSLCKYESCPLCDQKFFSELMKEASDKAGCLSSRARRLINLHVQNGMQRYITYLGQCFANPQQATQQECRMLIEYVMMNAVAMRKILKKYDKAGVYIKATRMTELDLLVKKRCKEYWKERMIAERAEMVKQSKIYWETQTKYMIGYE